MFATFKLVFILTGLGLPAGIVGIPYCWLIGDIGPLYRVSMRIIRLGLRAAGIRVEVEGLEHVPVGESVVFLSNHVSNLDPPVLLAVLPRRCSILLKRSLMRIPILGTALRMAKFVPVERGSRRDAAANSIAAAGEALRSGLDILVFPEGTRSPNGRLQAFKKGPFFLSQQTGARMIPIVVRGTMEMMGKGSGVIHPGVAHVKLLPGIAPGDFRTREDALNAVRQAINQALPVAMRYDEIQQGSGKSPAN